MLKIELEGAVIKLTFEVAKLRNDNGKLIRAMQEFVNRCEEGSIRSVRTYNKFKDIIEDMDNEL